MEHLGLNQIADSFDKIEMDSRVGKAAVTKLITMKLALRAPTLNHF